MKPTYLDDVYSPNDVLSFSPEGYGALPAVIWICASEGQLNQARLNCLRKALTEIERTVPGVQFWVLAWHRTWQPDNRVTRHYGFWKSLRKSSNVPAFGQELREGNVTNENGLRGYGLLRFNLEQIDGLECVFRAARAFGICFAGPPPIDRMMHLLEKESAGTARNPPNSLVELANSEEALLLDLYGSFDDPEAAVAVFGPPFRLNSLKPGS